MLPIYGWYFETTLSQFEYYTGVSFESILLQLEYYYACIMIRLHIFYVICSIFVN